MGQVTISDVAAAAERIREAVLRTPLIESRLPSARVWLKCECLQTGGSFKLRGATNRLLQMSADQRHNGVVAFSSGNHARGVAIAAARLGMPATIVMPHDAPLVKIEATKAEGAHIHFYDRRTESREEIAGELARQRGAVLVPSFDDPDIVAGQGTVGIEIGEQLTGEARRVVVPCGGGGLASGIALALPDADMTIVEPEGWDDMCQSLSSGEIVEVAADAPDTFCDALQTRRVSPITWGILRDRRPTALSVNDREVEDAIRFAWQEHQLVVEPGGATALAAALAGKVELPEHSVIILSGGNIDPGLHSRIVG